MNTYKLKYQQFGENTILVTWPEAISKEILEDILWYKVSIQSHYGTGVDCWHAYHSLAIQFRETVQNIDFVMKSLKGIYNLSASTRLLKNNIWKIPVCYESMMAPDSKFICDIHGITKEELVKIHAKATYKVYFNGFLPGFPYLGGLDERLFTPRKESPSLKVPKGSVAIGGMQTGIYPQESPGGWHVIGQTPIEIFNPQQNPPVLLQSGDSIEFYSINIDEFFQLKEAIKSKKFNYKLMLQHG